jgi:hypothetical protein
VPECFVLLSLYFPFSGCLSFVRGSASVRVRLSVDGNHVSYSLLWQEFQFVGLLSARLDPQNIFPLGPSLPVSGDCVCEFVEQFQFFTVVHLCLLARTHAVQFTSRTRRNALLTVRTHLWPRHWVL